eukprot:XP_011667052.1 PREDICTED: uncharacterized protein LOC105439578 [Strongylocentrotus purpuratus]
MFIVNGPPDTPRVRGINNLKSGSQSTLTCTSNNGYPTSLVHWYLGSENVTQYSSVQTELTYEQRVFTLSNLTFVPTRYNHGQLLVCEILHSAPPYSWTKNKTDVLNIAFIPDVYLLCRPDDIFNILRCLATRIRWRVATNVQSEILSKGCASRDRGVWFCHKHHRNILHIGRILPIHVV